MSTPSAIAAVTQTLSGVLRAQLEAADSQYKVTTLPLDKANDFNDGPNRLNLFLVQPSHNAALRNINLAHTSVHGEPPPLAIDLTYMITAYGDGTPEAHEHRILGVAMEYLNSHPVLPAQEIEDRAAGTGLELQTERVRITPRDLSLEEMSRLWSTFMTQYRTSAAYDVSVVLVDSTVPQPAPAPVLRRGEEDRGVFAEAELPAVLTGALAPELFRRGGQVVRQPAVRLGEALTLEGERLPAEDETLQIRSAAWGTRLATISGLAPGPQPGTLQVTLPDPPPETASPPAAPPLAWAPGAYSAVVAAPAAGRPDALSTPASFALAPRVQVSPVAAAPGDVTVTVECAPPPREDATTHLLLPGRDPLGPTKVTPPAAPGQAAKIEFAVKALTRGSYLARLRVDGVESLPYRVAQGPGGAPTLEHDPSDVIVIA